MKKVLPVLLMCLLLVVLLPLFSSAVLGSRSSQSGTVPDAPLPESYAEGQLLVTMQTPISLAGAGPNAALFLGVETVSVTDLTDINQFGLSGSGGANISANHLGKQILLLSLAEEVDIQEALSVVEQDPQVESVEYNLLGRACEIPISSDPGDFWNYEKIQADLAFDITGPSSEVRIGILDTGINEHPALTANIDFTAGYHFLTGEQWRYDSAEEATDDNGHGTFASGVAIGVSGNNDEGEIGKYSEATLVPLKIMDGGGVCDVAAFIQALTFAECAGIEILNFSGGYTGSTEPLALKDAIEAYSGLLIVAAGNNGHDIDDPSQAFYPASFDCANMITVAASNQDDELCTFSSFGPLAVDLTAPGENILNTSTYWHWNIDDGWFNEYGYETWSGTSAAVPHVTAAAALLKSLDPGLTAAQIKAVILDNVDYCSSLDSLVLTAGRLNVYQALLSLDMELESSLAVPDPLSFDDEPAEESLIIGESLDEEGDIDHDFE